MFDSKQNKLKKKFCEKIRKIISQKNSSKTLIVVAATINCTQKKLVKSAKRAQY